MDKKVPENLIKFVFGLIVIAGIWWIVKSSGINLRLISPAAVRDFLQGFGRLAAIIYILAYALNTISLFPPIAILSLSAGLVFGALWGALYLEIGAMLGASCTFFISRFFGRGMIEKLLKGSFKGLDDLLERRGFATILFFRIIPLMPYEALNYASGLSKIKFRDYFLASFLGFVPGVIVAAFFGARLGEVKNLRDILSLRFIIALLALILALLIPLIYRILKKRRAKL